MVINLINCIKSIIYTPYSQLLPNNQIETLKSNPITFQ